MITAQVDAYMAGLRHQGAIDEYKITCDESNNDPESENTGIINVSMDINSMYLSTTMRVSWPSNDSALTRMDSTSFAIPNNVYAEIKKQLIEQSIEHKTKNYIEPGDLFGHTIIQFTDDTIVAIFLYYIGCNYKIEN